MASHSVYSLVTNFSLIQIVVAAEKDSGEQPSTEVPRLRARRGRPPRTESRVSDTDSAARFLLHSYNMPDGIQPRFQQKFPLSRRLENE